MTPDFVKDLRSYQIALILASNIIEGLRIELNAITHLQKWIRKIINTMDLEWFGQEQCLCPLESLLLSLWVQTDRIFALRIEMMPSYGLGSISYN